MTSPNPDTTPATDPVSVPVTAPATPVIPAAPPSTPAESPAASITPAEAPISPVASPAVPVTPAEAPIAASETIPAAPITTTAAVSEAVTTPPALSTEAQLAAMRDASASLISEIVHGLRQPMTILRGYSDMLSTPGTLGALNEIQQQSAETIRANVISMDALLTDVSDYNKLISGRLRLEPKMTTYGQIVMDVQKQLEPLIAKLSRTPIWESPTGLPILVVDTKQVSKVMTKLISNALLYTPEGGTVTVKAERLPDNVLRIAVIDTGIGLTPEEVTRLGNLFFRGANEQVTSQKGYGMSMAVVTRLIPLMDSKLAIETVPDKGSTFSFNIVGMG